jgi:hypothetical protein
VRLLLIKVLSMSREAPVPLEGGGLVVASLQQRGLAAGRGAGSEKRYGEYGRGKGAPSSRKTTVWRSSSLVWRVRPYPRATRPINASRRLNQRMSL